MVPYTNYFQPMNNYGQPMQNPYAERMAQLQQYQQNLQANQMPVSNTNFPTLGKIVESSDIVKTLDIPMDGNMYYFPKADGTEIYGKQWLANGTTHTIVFKPVLEAQTEGSRIVDEKLNLGAFKELVEGIKQDITTLNDKIDRLNKPTRTKKESLDE